MAKDSNKMEELKKEKKESFIELLYLLVCLLVFPLFGLFLCISYICTAIINIYTINKQIKEQKIKDILGNVIIIKDENGFVKDIKL